MIVRAGVGVNFREPPDEIGRVGISGITRTTPHQDHYQPVKPSGPIIHVWWGIARVGVVRIHVLNTL